MAEDLEHLVLVGASRPAGAFRELSAKPADAAVTRTHGTEGEETGVGGVIDLRLPDHAPVGPVAGAVVAASSTVCSGPVTGMRSVNFHEIGLLVW